MVVFDLVPRLPPPCAVEVAECLVSVAPPNKGTEGQVDKGWEINNFNCNKASHIIGIMPFCP